MNSNLFKLGCNIWVHIAMYILQIPLFIYLLCKDLFLQKKKITEYCACIYMDFFRLQNLLNLHIYKCHIYLTQCSICMGSFYIFLIYMYLSLIFTFRFKYLSIMMKFFFKFISTSQPHVYTVYMEFYHLCYTCHMGLIRELFIFVYDMIFVN